jgi:hypothetical protein
LYLKAHFQNQRCVKAEVLTDGRASLSFLPGNGEWLFRLASRGKHFELQSELKVPGRVPYFQNLRLGELPEKAMSGVLPAVGGGMGIEANLRPSLQGAAPNPLELAVSEGPVVPAADLKKRQKLLQNIRSDIDKAERWLHDFEEVCQWVEQMPQAWEKSAHFPEHLRARVQIEIDKSLLPPWGKQSVASANEKLFEGRRRQIRRLQGARLRLVQVEASELKRQQKQREHTERSRVREGSSRRGPGIWVVLPGGIEARIGKSATENAELFRLARDRDLWFHVRGQAGAHVWVPRGQKGFGAKDEPPSNLIEEAALLALYNSKARSAGSAFVDYTERRHLRTRKGAVGAVEILRSQTRHVSLNEAFESRLKGK